MALLLGQGNEPAPTTLVLAVLPHWLNAILGIDKGMVEGTKNRARASLRSCEHPARLPLALHGKGTLPAPPVLGVLP